jgi:rubrerythrin
MTSDTQKVRELTKEEILTNDSIHGAGSKIMSRIVYWKEGDPEDQLWVCVSCGAELNADCIGDDCPACGVSLSEMITTEREEKE